MDHLFTRIDQKSKALWPICVVSDEGFAQILRRRKHGEYEAFIIERYSRPIDPAHLVGEGNELKSSLDIGLACNFAVKVQPQRGGKDSSPKRILTQLTGGLQFDSPVLISAFPETTAPQRVFNIHRSIS